MKYIVFAQKTPIVPLKAKILYNYFKTKKIELKSLKIILTKVIKTKIPPVILKPYSLILDVHFKISKTDPKYLKLCLVFPRQLKQLLNLKKNLFNCN